MFSLTTYVSKTPLKQNFLSVKSLIAKYFLLYGIQFVQITGVNEVEKRSYSTNIYTHFYY